MPSTKMVEAARHGIPVLRELHLRMFLGEIPNVCLEQTSLENVVMDWELDEEALSLGFKSTRFCGNERCFNPIHRAHMIDGRGKERLLTDLRKSQQKALSLSEVLENLEELSVDELFSAYQRFKR